MPASAFGRKVREYLRISDSRGRLACDFGFMEGEGKYLVPNEAAHELATMFFKNMIEQNFRHTFVSHNRTMFFKNIITNDLTMQNIGCIIIT